MNNNQFNMQMNNELQTSMAYPMVPSELDTQKNQEKEIKEAIEATDVAIKHIDKALGYINSAGDWGLFDVLCGGGCISSMAKQDKMTSAQNEMAAANRAIKKLEKEIKEVQEVAPLKLSGTEIFLDVFFDNIFSDLRVQSKIANAETKCRKCRRELVTIKKELNERLEQCQNPNAVKPTKKVVTEDNEKDLTAAFKASNETLTCLQKALRKITKAAKWVGDSDALCFGGMFAYALIENKVLDAQVKINDANKAITKLNKALASVVGMDDSKTSEINKFKEVSRDITESKNATFDSNAKFMEAQKCCISAISQVEAINNELKERLVKYQKEY